MHTKHVNAIALGGNGGNPRSHGFHNGHAPGFIRARKQEAMEAGAIDFRDSFLRRVDDEIYGKRYVLDARLYLAHPCHPKTREHGVHEAEGLGGSQ